jgi:hypothetical protein
MLFDLRGKRRRAVQVTYASLAALMAIGLVGAGIGSDVSGGVFDIFTGNDDADVSDANKATQKRIDRANDKLKVNPKDQAALLELVRGHYSIAASDADRRTSEFSDDGKKELEEASSAWKRYLATKPERIDPALGNLMINAYGPLGLNQPENAVTVAELAAEEADDPLSYIQLVALATAAGQTRKADLAADRALELAAPDERKAVKEQIEQAKAAAQPQPEGGGAAPAPGGGGQAPAPGG